MIRRLRVCCSIHTRRRKGAAAFLQFSLFPGQPLQGKPGRNARHRSAKGLQMGVHAPILLFHRKGFVQSARRQVVQNGIGDFQHQGEPVLSYQRKVSFPQSFITASVK